MRTGTRVGRPVPICLVTALAAFAVLVLMPVQAGAGTPSGSISGTIGGGSVPFVPFICWHGVKALDSDGNAVDTVSFESSSAGGFPEPWVFKLEGLEPGSTYTLLAGMDCGWPPDFYSYVEYYRDQTSPSAAVPITMGSGDVTGIDIVLEEPDPALEAPDTVIDSGPSGTITSDEATFEFHSTDPGNTSGFECKLDEGSFETCASPMTFTSLSDGAHTVSVRSVHAVAGHEDETPATQTFTVDTPVLRAKIKKLVVRGPARVKAGSRTQFRVKVTNSGNARADAVRLVVSGRGVHLTRSAGSIPAASTKAIRVKVRPTKTGKGRLTFKVTSSNAGSKTARRWIFVR